MAADVIGGLSDVEKLFTRVFRAAERARKLRSALARLNSKEDVRRFLYRYVGFNAVFVAGVSALSSALHLKSDAFIDAGDNNRELQDRSAEIASTIFFAAEAEYAVEGAAERITHRYLAQQFLRRVEEHLMLGSLGSAGSGLKEFRQSVIEGYGGQRSLSDEELFEALGFHAASEQCADQEFRILDEFLRKRVPEMVAALGDRTESAGIPSYYWIEVHCRVEEEHRRAAMNGIRLALRYYGGRQIAPIAAVESLVSGFRQFTGLQEEFFEFATT